VFLTVEKHTLMEILQAGTIFPLPDEDPYNAKYYGSERRRKFTNIYGIKDEIYARRAESITYSVLNSIERRSEDRLSSAPETINKYQWVCAII
jgi:hypothetical protein